MSSIRLSPFITFLSLWVLLISPSPTHSQTCKTQKFTNNQLYTHCLDLPSLSSYLHFTYDSQNKTLSVVFLASPPSSGGWISWGINPTALKMAGSRALVAYKDSKGTVAVNTYNISGYTPDAVTKTKKLDFEVWDTRAEEVSGVMRIYAKVKLTEEVAGKGRVNQVWQVGPGVGGDGVLTPHAMNPPNFNSVGSLDLNGGSGSVGGGGSGANSRLKKRNIHGILNAVSWGILFPIGAIVARYLRTFPSADPAWFFLHASCQVSAYAIGVAGWATGLKLGSESKGIQFTDHRNIGIALFAIATLQIFALFLRPKKDHKYRFYWNIYHHSVGYAILVLGILNVFKGLRILSPEHKWKLAYIIVIGVLGGIAVLLEAITWIVVLTRKSDKSTKPYDGYNNGQGRQQPLAP